MNWQYTSQFFMIYCVAKNFLFENNLNDENLKTNIRNMWEKFQEL